MLTLTARKAQTMGATGCVRHTGSSEGLFGDNRSFCNVTQKAVRTVHQRKPVYHARFRDYRIRAEETEMINRK